MAATSALPVDGRDSTASGLPEQHALLLRRAAALQAELETFSDHLSRAYEGYFQHVPPLVCSGMAGTVRAEMDVLERAARNLEADTLAAHRIHSTNLPFLEAVWDTAKRASDIVKMRHAVSSKKPRKQLLAPGTRIVRLEGDSRASRDCNIIIDLIADSGHSWYKVSSMNNKRLLYDMAKEAVYCGDSSDDDESDIPAGEPGGSALSKPEGGILLDGVPLEELDIPLIKLARNLADAAKGYRIRSESPDVYLVLPRMIRGEHAQIDKILAMCHRAGVSVLCSGDLEPPDPLSPALLSKMAPSPRDRLAKVLNLDTSVLVGLTSDFSHTAVVPDPWFRKSHREHAKLEEEEKLLSLIYPILGEQRIVCTNEAADAFRAIVNTIGRPAEKARAELLLWGNPNMSRQQRIDELQKLSSHPVPAGLQLPIHIEGDEASCHGRLSSSAVTAMKHIPNPSRAVFAMGWANSYTTVTCNSVAVKQLERDLENLPTLEDPWPSMWAFPTSRPLVGTPRPDNIRPRSRKTKTVADAASGDSQGTELDSIVEYGTSPQELENARHLADDQAERHNHDHNV
ncbi:DUF1308 domain-containing protein [Microdochium nivale]|nr:DUF1308 domain-containing protein [Microdochium nivale]